MAYDADMYLFYDPVEKHVIVSFQGTFTILPGPFPDRNSGIAAGEAYCRGLGWLDSEPTTLQQECGMQVHFTYNDGQGVEHDGTHDFEDINAAKRQALLYLAQSLEEFVGTTGVVTGAVAGLDPAGSVLFSVSMRVAFDEPTG